MPDPCEHTITVDRTPIYVREWGDPGAAPLVFWHALGSYSGLYLIEIAPVLAADYGLRVVALDAPGFGRSPALPADRYALPSLVGLLNGLLEELALERVVFMGFSWGGTVGCHFAASHPDRLEALVLIDAGYQRMDAGSDDWEADWTLDDFVADAAKKEREFRFPDWDAFQAEGEKFFKRFTPELLEAWQGVMVEVDGELRAVETPETVGAVLYHLVRDPAPVTFSKLGESGIPILLLAATEPADAEERRRRELAALRAAVPQVDVRRIEGARHDMIADVGPELGRIVGDWLSTLAYA